MNSERFKLIKDMLENNPGDSFLKYAAALEYKKSGDIVKAIQLLEELRTEHPHYLACYYQLGKLHEQHLSPQRAQSVYAEGLEIAKAAGDQKALSELREALQQISED